MSASQPSPRSCRNYRNSASIIPGHPAVHREPPCHIRCLSVTLATRRSVFARFCYYLTVLALLVTVILPAQAQVIDTIAGGFNGSTSPSENACAPFNSVATHGTDVYVSSCDQIFKVSAAGQWTHVAGNGINGFSPDGTLAMYASLGFPYSLSLDSSGNIFFNESLNNRIREIVAATGQLVTVAGTGTPGYSGDGGLAINAEISYGRINGIFVDGHGNVFIADSGNFRVREVVAATGIIQTVAGDGILGSSGDGGPATAAQLNLPHGVFVDGSGNIFIADMGNRKIREVLAATGKIQTVAGNGHIGFSGDGGPATSAELALPRGVFLDSSENIFIADTNNQRIREVVGGPGGNIKTVAGNGGGLPSGCYGGINACIGVGGPATNALVPSPSEVVLDSSGNIFVPNATLNTIEEVVATTGDLQIFAANGAQDFTGNNGPASKAQLNVPSFAATDSSGNVFIADTNNNVIDEIVSATGIIKIVAGNGIAGYTGDGGPATSAELTGPYSVIVDGSGNLFIADTYNNVIREVVATTGIITTVAGNVNAFCDYPMGDGGQATSAGLCSPTFAVVDSLGNLLIADSGDSVIRKVSAATGIINTVAGNGNFTYSGDGGPATSASLNSPEALFIDGSENLFIADTFNNVIREVVAATGNIRTIAGNGIAGFSGDGGPATSAQFFWPFNVWGDNSGNFVVSDFNNQVIRKFTLGGNIQTVAGNRVQGFAGDGGPASSGELDSPDSVFIEPSGSLLIADAYDGRVRIVGSATTTTLASSSNPAFIGQTVTFTVTVTPAGGGPPIGSVNFLDNGSAIGTATVNGSGKATFTTSTLATGDHPIIAQYFGTNFPGSISSPLVQEVDVVNGNLTISSGQNYTFVNGNIPGNIVMNGGTVVLNNTVVAGNLKTSGGNLTLSNNSTVQGNLHVSGNFTSVQITGTKVLGNLQMLNSFAASPVSISNNSVSGNLRFSFNFAGGQIFGNTVLGNLDVADNVLATYVISNKVGGNLLIQNNGPTQVWSNTVKSNLQCSGNYSFFTGGGNVAGKKLGQCASF